MNDTDRIRFHIAIETDGEISPAQIEGPPPSVEQIAEVERMCAADKVMKMRRVRELAPSWHELTRASYARTFDVLAKEFAEAAAYLRRVRADDRDELPQFLRRQAD